MTTHTVTSFNAAIAFAPTRQPSLWHQGMQVIARWFSRPRHAPDVGLTGLSAHELSDIGLTRGSIAPMPDPMFATEQAICFGLRASLRGY